MRTTVGAMLAVGLALLAGAPAAAEVKTKDITFKAGKDTVKGYLAVPEGKGPFPAVVVIQEWWGLNDWMKEQSKRLAGQGYVALAPDLYRGKVTDDPKKAKELLNGLPRERALADLQGAVDALAKMDNVRKDKIGSIGWCMGGGYSLELALADKRIKACVICYGPPILDADKLKPLNAAVLGVFGTKDMGIPIPNVRKFKAALEKAGKKVEIYEYPAGHGFMRAYNGPDKKNPVYDEASTKKAWAEIDKFFAKALKGKG